MGKRQNQQSDSSPMKLENASIGQDPEDNQNQDPPKVILLPEGMQNGTKRRRVVRACDRCRKLKIKCSGDLPCIHCTVYNYECTYAQPNKSKRKPPPPPPASSFVSKEGSKNHEHGHGQTQAKSPYIKPKVNFKSVNTVKSKTPQSQSMERFNSSTVSVLAASNPELFSKLTDRLKLYDDILHRLLPDIKLTDLNDNPKPINPMKLMTALNKLRQNNKDVSKASSKQIAKVYDSLPDMPLPSIPISKLPPSQFLQPDHLQSQPQSQSQPLSQPSQAPENPSISRINSSLNLNSNQSQDIDGSLQSSMGKEIKIILPSREVALDLITKTWENACVLFRFYHRVAFIEDLNELYDTDPNQYSNKQQRFLPLVYSVMACGALFYKSDENTLKLAASKSGEGKNDGNNGEKEESDDEDIGVGSPASDHIQRQDVEDEGYRYFIAARKLIDITDTRDTYGIQTIVMLIIFLQCSARLSTCYAYIGIALRAALREGLHRKLDYPFNPIELEIRKRLFWTIYKMDIYVNTMLGLPRTISSDDFDQDMPIELDDENITVTGYRFDRQGDRLSSSGIANAHTRLILIMKEVVTKLYPIKPQKVNRDNDNNANSTNSNESMRSSYVYELELQLQDWMNGLPLELKPGVEPPHKYLKANRLLHISYLHVKIILYRPFIHYVSAKLRSNSLHDVVCIEKAKNCINVARLVVKLSEDMINKNMLSGSYWFSIYTIFFSVACLVYYVHFAPPVNKNGELDQEYIAIKKDAENGKRVLDILKDSSMAARRTYNILNALFEQLNRKTARASSKSQEENMEQFVPAHMASASNDFGNQQFSSSNANEMVTSYTPPFSQFTPNGKTPLKGFTPDNSDPNGITGYKYVPGPMDQMEMKVFGRFLPPYMLDKSESEKIRRDRWAKSNQAETAMRGEGQMQAQEQRQVAEQVQPQGQEAGGISTTPMQDPAKQEDLGVFTPDIQGLFDFMKHNNDAGDKDHERRRQTGSQCGSGVGYEYGDGNGGGNGGGNGRISGNGGEGEGEGGSDWIDAEVLDTTNEFFNQVNNAIPSGLTTVFQSETDKNATRDGGLESEPAPPERTIELPSRFTSNEGVEMLDELLFGSGWDHENAGNSESPDQH